MKSANLRVALIAAGLAGNAGLLYAGTGSVTAFPTTCEAPYSTSPCTTQLTVTYSGSAWSQLWVQMDSNAPQLVGCGGSSVNSAPWIMPDHQYTFTLYETPDCTPARPGAPLSSVVVQGKLSAPVFNSPAAGSIVTAYVGIPVNIVIAADGATSYSADLPLPPGLYLQTFLGTGINGTPTAPGQYTLTLHAANHDATSQESFSLSVQYPPQPTITTGSLPNGQLQTAYSATISASNFPQNFIASGLPPGLSMDSGSGIISGTPSSHGTYSIVLSASNANPAGPGPQKAISLTILNLPPSITSAPNASGIAGQFFSYQITGANGPLTYTASTFDLPPGLTFSASGLISGIVPSQGFWTVPIGIQNDVGSASSNLSINIAPPPPAITGPATATAVVGVPASGLQFQATNNGTFINTGMPPGLAMTAGGLIVGTPLSAGTFPVTITAGNITGTTTTLLDLTVYQPPIISQQPINQTVVAGRSATFSVTASGTPPITYQWYRKDSAQSAPIALVDQTGPHYTTSPSLASDNGAEFFAILHNPANVEVQSEIVNLTVTPPPSVATPIIAPSGGTFTNQVSITLTCSTPGADIRYTTDGSPPTPASTPFGAGPITLAANALLRVQAYKSGWSDSAEASAAFTIDQTAAIITQPTDLAVTIGLSATFSVAATAVPAPSYQWYRSDNSPILGATGSSYTTSPTTLADDQSRYFVVVDNALHQPLKSNIVTLSVNTLPTAATPQFSPAPGTFIGSAAIAMTCATSGAVIHYTTDGSVPTENSPIYSGSPITITSTTILSAKAFEAGYNPSAADIGTYTVNFPPSILLSPLTQTVIMGQSAVWNVSAQGTPPFTYQWYRKSDASSAGAPIAGATRAQYTLSNATLADNQTEFYVVVTNVTDQPATSPLATLTVNPLPTVATPLLSQATGSYTNSVTVSITCVTPQAEIRYTLDGSTPGPTSLLYTGAPLTITLNTLLRAQAYASGMTPSAEADATYTLNYSPAIHVPPADAAVLPGQTATFSVVASGTTLHYQWFKNDAPIAGATLAAYTTPPTAAADNGSQFKVMVTNITGVSVTGGPAILSVNTPTPSTVATPTISPNGGHFTGSISVTLACATPNALITYSLNGSAPVTYYGQAILLTANTTLTTQAFVSGMKDSSVATAAFIQDPQTPPPSSISIGPTTPGPAGRIQIPVQFTHGPSGVSVLQFHVALPAGISDISATPGTAAITAGKTVSTGLNGTDYTVIVMGFNSTTISDGDIVDLSVRVLPSATGTLPLHLFNVGARDPLNNSVPLTAVDGSLIVSGGTALATPAFAAYSALPVDGLLTVTYSGVDAASYLWTIAPDSSERAALEAAAMPLQTSASMGRTLTTNEPRLPLAPLALTPGRYIVTAQVVDVLGNRSTPAETEITLFSPSVYSAHVWPNPWRADRPAPAITFDQMAVNSTVKIFTVSGRWVRTLAAPGGSVPWDLKNGDGDLVASGLYIYLVTDDQGGKSHGKLAIIR